MALESQGVKLFWSTSSGAESTVATCVIDEVISFSGPTGAAGIIDITHLLSSAKEKLTGVPDWGNMSLELSLTSNMGSTGLQGNLRDSFISGTKGKFMIKYSTDNYFVSKGYVVGLNPSGAVDDKIGVSVTIELTGEASWVAT